MKKIILSLMIIFCSSPVLSQINSEEIRFSIGEKQTLFFPNLKKVEVSNPKVVRLHRTEKEEVVIEALSKGNTLLLLQDEGGPREIPIIVYSKLALDLEREIKELTAHIEGIQIKNIVHQVIISGKILTPEDNNTLREIEKHYENVINLAKPMPSANILPMEKMIQVELKMIEVNQQKIKAIGLKFPDSINTHFTIDREDRDDLVTTTLKTSTQFDLLFNAFEKKGMAKILANPKLVCKNGGEAHFLAGGEIPIRLTHAKSLSVQWKSYGILFHILPTTDPENHIFVNLKMEVSTLNNAQMVEGIPGILTRRIETSINVEDGETIVLSGLVHQENGEDIHQVPLISSIPIIGNLFQSREFQNKNSELMIFVTPTVKKT